MKNGRLLVLLLMLASLDLGLICSLAETPGSPASSNSNDDQFLPSALTGTDRAFFQNIQVVLAKDPDYKRLGLSDEQWRNLWTKSDCVPMAMAIRNPAKGEEIKFLNRPQLQLVLDIADLEATPKGSLLEELSSNAELNKKLKNIADYAQYLLQLVSMDNPLGLVLDLLKHAAEKVGSLIKTGAATDSFNNLYNLYKTERDKAPNADPKSIVESMGLDVGAHKVDYANIRQFYLDLNKNANLGWNPANELDRITMELSFYLESRYKSEKGTLDPWDAPINKPEDAIENQLRDATHAMKIQLAKNLRRLVRDCLSLPNIEGSWKILQPIQADMMLVQTDDTVKGDYHNSEVQGTIEGKLTTEGEDTILTGSFADQTSKGDFRVSVAKVTKAGEVAAVGSTMLYGNWKYIDSQGWDGIFEGVKSGETSGAGNIA